MVRLLLGVFGSVFHDLNEFLKLLPCPEQHLIGVFLTHTSRLVAWILFQSIVLDCVLDEYHVKYENRAKHSGRQVKLTYMVIDNVEYEVIE